MTDCLTLPDRPALPLPFADGSFRRLDLRDIFKTFAADDQLFLLLEARRVLQAGGELRLAAGTAEAAAMARRIGLELPQDEPASNAGRELVLRKADRRPSGTPLVSLLIPAYSPTFFEASMASAIAQSHDRLEIIVCDDSGGDEIERIALRLARSRPLDYFRNAVRLRGRGNYARCFDLASGEFIKFLNDDDVLAPDCVARLLDAFRRAPEASIATSYRQRIDPAGRPLPDQRATRPLAESDMIVSGASMANAMLMAGINVIGEPSTTMFRKQQLLEAIPEDFAFVSDDSFGIIDMAMWLPLLLKGDTVYLRAGLSQFRQHEGQQQRDATVVARRGSSIRKLQARWLALGLYRRFARDALMAKPLDSPGADWRAHPFAAFEAAPRPPPQGLRYSVQIGAGTPSTGFPRTFDQHEA